ncbi:SfnB family sulfur acquisition oxidoreductase [Rhizobium sp. BK251]|uniref:SfnB family sulfur acquisition oxidoreductase n=1 Tax=Rhizobium sp. BK251 TaxID=2512125 RepID=UPI0010530922|nr:SfnB family sulfur acquisition oxidoreductase [Rhizobium sp. BK251]TCL71840.1 SfnB family sulfur acquisition oxidoreductase [Rhizobium sp. BK251]
MGTVSQLHERVRPAAHRIQSDEEALEIARTLAAGFAKHASDRDINRVLPHDEMDTLSQSGLLGITVPAEYGGLDISNAILAEVIALLAEGDPSVGEILQNHFHVLEVLRADGSEEQRKFFFGRALAGDRFGRSLPEAGPAAPDRTDLRLTPEGPGHRLNGREPYSTGVLFADWLAMFAPDASNRQTMSLVPRGTEGVQLIDDWDGFGQRTTGSGTAAFHNVYVAADATIFFQDRPARATVASVGQLVHAAVDLGIARAAFSETLTFVRDKARHPRGGSPGSVAEDAFTVSKIGQIAIRIEAATAMVERAGKKVDAAQVDATDAHIVDATLAVAAANVLTTEIALDAANTLFELAGAASTRIGLNLDRHWRNARTHTLQDPVGWKYHEVGNYHLNAITLPHDDTP